MQKIGIIDLGVWPLPLDIQAYRQTHNTKFRTLDLKPKPCFPLSIMLVFNGMLHCCNHEVNDCKHSIVWYWKHMGEAVILYWKSASFSSCKKRYFTEVNLCITNELKNNNIYIFYLGAIKAVQYLSLSIMDG